MSWSLCQKQLPHSSSRRRLYGLSSSNVLQCLQAETKRLRAEGIIPPRPATSIGGPYLCLACFSHIERISSTRVALYQLESELEKNITSTASTLNVIPKLLNYFLYSCFDSLFAKNNVHVRLSANQIPVIWPLASDWLYRNSSREHESDAGPFPPPRPKEKRSKGLE